MKTFDENGKFIQQNHLSLLSMFVVLRNRLRETKEPPKNGNSSKWYLEKNCPLFISPSGQIYSKVILNPLNKVLLSDGVIPEEIKITPNIYRRYLSKHISRAEDDGLCHGLNTTDESNHSQPEQARELKNVNWKLLEGEIYKNKVGSTYAEFRQRDDKVGPSDPVTSKVKEMFDESAAVIDKKWKLQAYETIRAHKSRLLKIVLHESVNGIVLRKLLTRMYQGNEVWSVRHSVSLKKNKGKSDVHEGLNETLKCISGWEDLSLRTEMFISYLSCNYELLSDFKVMKLEDFKLKLSKYSDVDLDMFLKEVTSKKSSVLFLVDGKVYSKYAI